MYDYKATLIRVVDGDTLHVSIDLGCDTSLRMTVRLYGINSPEMSTLEGKEAKAYAERWFAEHAPDGQLMIRTRRDKKEKYGRYLAIVYYSLGQEPLNDALVREGKAVVYLP